MNALLEERENDMFPKSSVFAAVAWAAFLSLGALLFPQVVQAQCLFDCVDLGSDPSANPFGNSPQALDLAYCFDRACVLNLTDSSGNPIFTGNNIPTPHVVHNVLPSVTTCDGTIPGPYTVTISTPPGDYVVALLRDPATGTLIPGTQALATLNIVIEGVTCSVSGNGQILSKVLTLDPNFAVGAPRTDVFDKTSNITILPPIPSGWVGCPTPLATTQCQFPLGIVEFKTKHDLGVELPATSAVPSVNSFQVGEVYRGVTSTKFVGVRDCKGDPSVPPASPSTIACSVGGGDAQGLFTFLGNWSGATNHTINPNSGNNPFDIQTPLFGDILPDTVTASANNGPEVPNNGCNAIPSHTTERCFFTASALLPNGCTPGAPVNILVRGKLNINGTEFGFASRDNPTCSTK